MSRILLNQGELDKKDSLYWDLNMPTAKIFISKELETEKLERISSSISSILSSVLNKSEEYIMTIFPEIKYQSFAKDSFNLSVYIEIKNVGELIPDITSTLSSKITDAICEITNVVATRVYIEFQQSERHMWGWNGKTFHS